MLIPLIDSAPAAGFFKGNFSTFSSFGKRGEEFTKDLQQSHCVLNAYLMLKG